MTSSTRYFLFGGATVLGLGLAGGLVMYFGGVPTLGALAGEPDELVYVPENAAVVAFADVRRVMDSELRQEIREMLPERARGRDVDGRLEFQDATGIDLEKDVDDVLAYLRPDGAVVTDGTPVGRGRSDEVLVLIRGRFDQARIEQLVEEHGGVAETYRDKRLIVRRAGGEPSEPGDRGEGMPPAFGVGFLQAGLIAVGTRTAIMRALDLESGTGVSVTRNDTLMELIRDSDSGDVWAVGRFDGVLDRARIPGDLADRLPPITYFAASGRVDGGFAGRVRADARDEASAEQLGDVIRGFVALARMQAGSNPRLGTVLQSLQLHAEGHSVVLEFALPSGTLRSLAPSPGETPPAP